MNIFLLIVALHFIIGLIVAVMYFVKGWIKVEDDIMDDIQRIAYRQKIHKDQTDEWMEDKIKHRHLAELKGIEHFQGVEYDEIEEKVFLSMHVRSCLFGGFIWEIILVCAIIAGLFWCIFKISELIENQIVRFFQFAERLFTRNKS